MCHLHTLLASFSPFVSLNFASKITSSICVLHYVSILSISQNNRSHAIFVWDWLNSIFSFLYQLYSFGSLIRFWMHLESFSNRIKSGAPISCYEFFQDHLLDRILYIITFNEMNNKMWVMNIKEHSAKTQANKNRTEGLKMHSNAWMNFGIILVNEKNNQREDILWVSSDVKF